MAPAASLGSWIPALRRRPLRADELALRGERLAERHLARRGYLTLARRHKTRRGELDLVMRDGQAIVVVEVKTRRSASHGAPAEAVTASKAEHLRAASRSFLRDARLTHRPWRIDVVAVLCDPRGRLLELEHLPGAVEDAT